MKRLIAIVVWSGLSPVFLQTAYGRIATICQCDDSCTLQSSSSMYTDPAQDEISCDACLNCFVVEGDNEYEGGVCELDEQVDV